MMVRGGCWILVAYLSASIVTRSVWAREHITKEVAVVGVMTDSVPARVEIPQPGRLVSIQVNVGRWGNVSEVVTALKTITVVEGQPGQETVLGVPTGKWSEPIVLNANVRLVGISGRYGKRLDSICFHFSDGSHSAILGGKGGDTEARWVSRRMQGDYPIVIQGLFVCCDAHGLSGIGLTVRDIPGIRAPWDFPEELVLTTRGTLDKDLIPVVGTLASWYYECYPRLLDHFDNPHKPASRHIRLVFKKLGIVGPPAYCVGSEITLNVDYLRRHPHDLGMLTHELTHAVQNYPDNNLGWLTEGIADYARHRYGPRNEPNWKLPKQLQPGQNYKDGYTTTARFLVWLESKHPNLVTRIHREMQNRAFTLTSFKEWTGQDVDQLWKQCQQELADKPKLAP